MSLGVYDPKEVTVIWGNIIWEGFADGTFVTAARNNQSFNLRMGATGDGTRAKSNDRSGTVTCTLLQSSPTNLALSQQMLLDENTPKGDGIAPLLVQDSNGETILSAKTAWLQKPADVVYGQEAEAREWVLETDELLMTVGGNIIA